LNSHISQIRIILGMYRVPLTDIHEQFIIDSSESFWIKCLIACVSMSSAISLQGPTFISSIKGSFEKYVV